MPCLSIPRTAWILRARLNTPWLASTFASAQPKASSCDIFISQCLDTLHRQTKDPLWKFLNVLGTHQPGDSLALAFKDVSLPFSDYRNYQRLLEEGNDSYPALLKPQKVPAEPHEALPAWVLGHLLTRRFRRPSNVVLDPYSNQRSNLPLNQKAPMLIFAAAHFASLNLLLPLHRVVHEFLNLPHPISTPILPPLQGTPCVLTLDNDANSELYFNLFLRALACSPKYSTAYSIYVTSTIHKLSTLRDPSGRAYQIHTDTYSCLLLSTRNEVRSRHKRHQGRLLSPHLVLYLCNRMREENFQPTPKHLEAMLRHWAKEAIGNTKSTNKRGTRAKAMVKHLWEELQRLGYKESRLLDTANLDSPTLSSIRRSNTLYLGAQGSIKDIREVLDILQNSTASRDNDETLPVITPEPAITKTTLDEYDLTATLHSAANDMRVSSNALMAMFNKLTGSDGAAQVPLAAHTVFLRGLVFRKDFDRALRWWNHHIMGPQRRLDRMALTVGAQILTRVSRPNEAFALLEQHSWKPSALSTPSSDATEPIRLTSITVTEWMVSVKRIARPDVVFQLWDYMYPLYGALHTVETLNIMLQSARMAVVMDGRSVRTQLSNYFQLGRAKLSSSSPAPPRMLEADPEVRNQGREKIRALLGDPGNEPVPYRGGLWRGKRPEDTARHVFLQIMFGMEAETTGPDGTPLVLSSTGATSLVGLANVKAPSRSVRQDWDSDAGVVGLGLGLPELKLQSFEYKPGPEMYDWSRTRGCQPGSHYPHLVLDNKSFLCYISLLAVTDRTAEVALTMAWMRELGIQPSQSTLGLAMVLWGEVSVEGPLVQALAKMGRGGLRNGPDGKGGGWEKVVPVDEYDRFVLWLKEWVGEKRMPDEDVLRKWRTTVKDMREARAVRSTDVEDDQ